MKRAIAGLILCIISLPVMAQEAIYRLNPGDILDISVWKEEGMQRVPDGMISFPLAGHLMAAGKSPQEIQESLVARIKEFIPDPQITVTVLRTAGYKIYVVGQVNNPGEFPVTHRIDVMQALSLARGLTPFGDEDDIKILRRDRASGEVQALSFDYSAVKNGEDLETNIQLESGDVVVVSD